MRLPVEDLSIQAIAILAYIVGTDFGAPFDELLKKAVAQPPDVDAVVGNVQTLLDRELVVRVERDHRYVYANTPSGRVVAAAFVHQRGYSEVIGG
jgi:hypothetical protein